MPDIGWIAGVCWSGNEGTEVRMVREVALRASVVWLDPVAPFWRQSLLRRTTVESSSDPGPRIVRLLGPPGVTRIGVRVLANRKVGRYFTHSGSVRCPRAVVLASPVSTFPALGPARRVLYVTDNWVAGASLMGLSRRFVENTLRRNLDRAHTVAVVSPMLASQLSRWTRAPIHLVPNGCAPKSEPASAEHLGVARPAAGLIGTINERLDLGFLEDVARRAIPLVLVGPRMDRSPEFAARFERLVRMPNVRYLGPVQATRVPSILAAIDVGLTPYADTGFNQASFPLKTLEYLAAGLPVVSTPLHANQWLATDLISTEADPVGFGDRVQLLLAAGAHADEVASRIRFARRHSWAARAEQLVGLALEGAGNGATGDGLVAAGGAP